MDFELRAGWRIRRTDDGASHGHGLGLALGADSAAPHGISSRVLLPTGRRFDAEVGKLPRGEVAAALGDAWRPAADQGEALFARLGLPMRIGQLGVERSRGATIAEKDMAVPCVCTRPCKIASVGQVIEILEAAW
jgi:alcohol dehydrogenase class IV